MRFYASGQGGMLRKKLSIWLFFYSLKSMITPKINFRGKEYNSIEELPPEARQAFEKLTKVLDDKDQNGVPDFFEGKAGVGDLLKNVFHSTTSHDTGIIKTEINIENPQNIDVFTSESSPYKNLLHEKIATSSTRSTFLFFVGVLVSLFTLGVIVLFLFKSGFFSH